MFKKLKSFFDQALASESHEQPLEKRLQLATAALLIEMVNADYEILDIEKEQLVASLKTGYSLADEEIQELISLSEAEHGENQSLYPFTRLINDNYNEQQKREVIRLMWQIALADGHIDKHEMHLMRKISDLLYIDRPVVMEIKNQEIKRRQANN